MNRNNQHRKFKGYRHLLAETLERRNLLAILGLGVEFHEPGSSDVVSYLEAGKTYEVSVVVQASDASDSGVGVISLPLSYSWDPDVMGLSGDSAAALDGATYPLTGASVSSDVLTSSFPLQRTVTDYRPDAVKLDPASADYRDGFNLVGVGGGSLPNLDGGSGGFGNAIGAGAAEAFTPKLQFTLDAESVNYAFTTFTIGLNGSMSFSDASALESVVGIGANTQVLSLPNAANAQVVRTTIPIAIGGSKREFETTGDPLALPAQPVMFQLDLGSDGTFEDSTTTDAQGEFEFVLPPDSWPMDAGATALFSIQETTPDGRVYFSPADGRYSLSVDSDGRMQVVTPAGAEPPLAFVNRIVSTPVSVSGIKFNDRADAGTIGVYDAGIDTPLAGAVIGLDLNNDGTRDSSATSDLLGRYTFDSLPQGTHRVYEVSNNQQSFPLATDGSPDSYLVSVVGSNVSVTTAGGGADVSATALRFGNLLDEPVSVTQSVSGYVFNDTNLDGNRDANELGLPGVSVRLVSSIVGVATRATTTGPDGWYHFDAVTPSTYTIEEIQPSGYLDASISLGTVIAGGTATGTVDGANRFTGVVVGNGQHALDYNFGETFSAITKRNLLTRNSPGVAATDTLGIHSIEVFGTQGDDDILIQRMNEVWRVTINDNSTDIPLTDRVVLDALGGNDQVEIIGSSAAEFVHVQAGQVALTVDPNRGSGLLVLASEQTIVDGRLGNDRAVISGGSGIDQLIAAGDSASVRYGDSAGSGAADVELLSFDAVRAINPNEDVSDEASVAAIDYVLELVGRWNQ